MNQVMTLLDSGWRSATWPHSRLCRWKSTASCRNNEGRCATWEYPSNEEFRKGSFLVSNRFNQPHPYWIIARRAALRPLLGHSSTNRLAAIALRSGNAVVPLGLCASPDQCTLWWAAQSPRATRHGWCAVTVLVVRAGGGPPWYRLLGEPLRMA